MITPQHQGLRSVTSNTLQNYHPIPRYFTKPNKLNFPTPRLPGGGKAYFYRVGHGSSSSISLATRGHPGRAVLGEGVQSRAPPFAEQGAEPGALPRAPPSEGHQVNPPPDGTQRAASVPLTAAARSVPPPARLPPAPLPAGVLRRAVGGPREPLPLRVGAAAGSRLCYYSEERRLGAVAIETGCASQRGRRVAGGRRAAGGGVG